MPSRTIWIREDDLEAFEAIPDRPGWIHKAILSADILEAIDSTELEDKEPEIVPEKAEALDEAELWDESDIM